MGCCRKSPEDLERERAVLIDKQLRMDRKQFSREIKLLLLGTGESGKSTIVKQMKIIHLNGFKADDERKEYRTVVYGNVLVCAKSLVKAVSKFNLTYENGSLNALAEKITTIPAAGDAFTPDLGRELIGFWKDPSVQQAFERRSEYQLNDSADYYFNDLARISEPNYIPDVQDILRARVMTTGIQETEFTYSQVKFRMVDVGGQRNERRKWIHCFQDVTAIIFCVALSEYDQVLYEDESQNRMVESLLLFDEITNSRWFANTSMILFLNKTDLFQEKVRKVNLNVCFSEYSGGLDYDKALAFIKQQFLALNKNPERKKIYPHETCATDTRNIKFVFEAVKDIIIQSNLYASGF